MNDYFKGVIYATGYIANENNRRYLVVRNLDQWYPALIGAISSYKVYESKSQVKRDGRPQWVIKAKEITRIPNLNEVINIKDFARAYIELHSVLDIRIDRRNHNKPNLRLRLIVYGQNKILAFLNEHLPSKPKKIQHIINRNNGETCGLYYQSAKEIVQIFRWIDGDLKNIKVWDKWEDIINKFKKGVK